MNENIGDVGCGAVGGTIETLSLVVGETAILKH